MTIKEIYNLAIKKGIENDFRGKKGVDQMMERRKKSYEKMSKKNKEYFDKEDLTNPYSDTRILYGDEKKKVKKALVGIDIDGEELLYAKQRGDIDLVISHHPRGKGLLGLDSVMDLQVDLLHYYGVPINIAEKLLKKRISEVSRGIAPGNHYRAVDMARLLDIPFMCVHTPADNMVAKFIEKAIEKKKPYFVEDLMGHLLEVEEYKIAKKMGAGPRLFVGSESNRAGKVVVTEVTGGTEGSPQIYEKLAQAGAGTVVGMHMSEKHREEAEKAHINVVIAGHISSDSIGVNLFLDLLQGVEVVSCGGLIRVSR